MQWVHLQGFYRKIYEYQAATINIFIFSSTSLVTYTQTGLNCVKKTRREYLTLGGFNSLITGTLVRLFLNNVNKARIVITVLKRKKSEKTLGMN